MFKMFPLSCYCGIQDSFENEASASKYVKIPCQKWFHTEIVKTHLRTDEEVRIIAVTTFRKCKVAC